MTSALEGFLGLIYVEHAHLLFSFFFFLLLCKRLMTYCTEEDETQTDGCDGLATGRGNGESSWAD